VLALGIGVRFILHAAYFTWCSAAIHPQSIRYLRPLRWRISGYVSDHVRQDNCTTNEPSLL
jgi:hypothetical protein